MTDKELAERLRKEADNAHYNEDWDGPDDAIALMREAAIALERCDATIARMQDTMSRQAEEWTRQKQSARRKAFEEAADFAGGSTMPRHEIADYLKAKGYNVPADMIHHALRLYMMPAIRALAETGGGDGQ